GGGRRRDVRLAADDEGLLHRSLLDILRRSFSKDVRGIGWRHTSNAGSDKYGRIQMELANNGRGANDSPSRGSMIPAWICPRPSPGWWTRRAPRPALSCSWPSSADCC